ncbi:DUF6090 family protein [uncultured Aquimarina sp.]|uniref:DUF6090 family protein n=1 Tax=uncultured Aquimarina sp. TaxID=575652 RepID=UPI002636465B|nr:DUF6090 family protein [uncultured Aquimarina sp.]
MIKFFRSLRQDTISKNKFTKYFLYAIGEIVLVVIGILIALQINNWNQSIKKQQTLKNILNTVSYDLITDTTVTSRFIKIEEEMIKHSSRIINKEINITNYKECPYCPSIATTYRPFNINLKGYDQLRSLIEDNTSQKDSLLTDIVQFYTIHIGLIEQSNDMLKNTVFKNVEDFQKYDWFVDWTQGHPNPDMIAYFASGEEYRKKVAAYSILASKNHLLYLKSFNRNAIYILDKLDKRNKN